MKKNKITANIPCSAQTLEPEIFSGTKSNCPANRSQKQKSRPFERLSVCTFQVAEEARFKPPCFKHPQKELLFDVRY